MSYKDKEKEKEYYKGYYKKNKEKKKKYGKIYRKKPENKARAKEYDKEYHKNNKDKIKEYKKKYMKEYNKKYRKKNEDKIKEYNKKPEVKKRRKEWSKEYNKKFENKTRINANDKQRRKNDKKWAIKERVRSNFNVAMKKYSTTGKIMPKNKYLDMEAIIKKLTPFPDLSLYEVDHIIPLVMFNHDDLEQVKKAWLPSNLQWLPKEINRWKGNKLVHPAYHKKYRYNPKKILQ